MDTDRHATVGWGVTMQDVQSPDAFSHAGTTSMCTQNSTADHNHMGFSSPRPEQTGSVLLLEAPILMVSNLQLHPPPPTLPPPLQLF